MNYSGVVASGRSCDDLRYLRRFDLTPRPKPFVIKNGAANICGFNRFLSLQTTYLNFHLLFHSTKQSVPSHSESAILCGVFASSCGRYAAFPPRASCQPFEAEILIVAPVAVLFDQPPYNQPNRRGGMLKLLLNCPKHQTRNPSPSTSLRMPLIPTTTRRKIRCFLLCTSQKIQMASSRKITPLQIFLPILVLSFSDSLK